MFFRGKKLEKDTAFSFSFALNSKLISAKATEVLQQLPVSEELNSFKVQVLTVFLQERYSNEEWNLNPEAKLAKENSLSPHTHTKPIKVLWTLGENNHNDLTVTELGLFDTQKAETKLTIYLIVSATLTSENGIEHKIIVFPSF